MKMIGPFLAAGCLIAALGCATPAQATPILSPLDCTIVGGATSCPNNSSPIYGTLTFDVVSANTVSIAVALTSPATIQDIFLNLSPGLTADTFTATANGSAVSVASGSNSQIPNGAGNPANEAFDLQVPSNGTLTGFGTNFTINVTDAQHNLAPTDIVGQLTAGGLDAAVHLQNCSGIGACTDSLVVGENTTSSPSVPEPMSLVLLGTGLAALGAVRRRFSES